MSTGGSRRQRPRLNQSPTRSAERRAALFTVFKINVFPVCHPPPRAPLLICEMLMKRLRMFVCIVSSANRIALLCKK